MEIGAAWWKQKKDKNGQLVNENGKPVYQLSVQINLPFLGTLNFTLSPNQKGSQGAPDYLAFYWPPRKENSGQQGGAPGYQGGGGPAGGYGGGRGAPAAQGAQGGYGPGGYDEGPGF